MDCSLELAGLVTITFLVLKRFRSVLGFELFIALSWHSNNVVTGYKPFHVTPRVFTVYWLCTVTLTHVMLLVCNHGVSGISKLQSFRCLHPALLTQCAIMCVTLHSVSLSRSELIPSLFTVLPFIAEYLSCPLILPSWKRVNIFWQWHRLWWCSW